MPNVLVSILALLFCQSRFPMVNKTKSGQILSSLYKASVCNQSLHLPTHYSLPPSPTSFNPFILLIHLPIYPSTHTDSIDPSFLFFSNFPQHAAVSLWVPVFNFLCVFMRTSSELLPYMEHHPASYSSSSTQSHLGAAQYHHSRLLLAPLEQLRIKSCAEGHLESSGC